MDPVTQGALGAVLPQSLKNIIIGKADTQNSESQSKANQKTKIITITWLGALSGMAPDLDVLIQSSTDPLLFLEFHRQFTHSLFFIPIGALICCLALHRFAKHSLSFKQAYIVCFLAYATHGLLDACTSYGTQLFWPITDMRVSWNNVSVVDPLVTVPLLILVVLSWLKANVTYARFGFGWVIFYLLFGVVQHQRAAAVALAAAEQRGHVPQQLTIRPGFANLLLWKSIYLHDDLYYVDALRMGTTATFIEGDSVERLNATKAFPWLDENSQQAKDLSRFDWFSQGYLALDKQNPYRVVDMRYSILPNEVDPLWLIELDPTAAIDQHVKYITNRDTRGDKLNTYWQLLLGQPDDTVLPDHSSSALPSPAVSTALEKTRQ